MGERRTTSTSNFGVGKRESHDAAAFYARFEAPEVSLDKEVAKPKPVKQPVVCGDARTMDGWVEDNSVALADGAKAPFVLLTAHLPRKGTEGDKALRAAGPSAFFDAVESLGAAGQHRLKLYAGGGRQQAPEPGFWTEAEIARGR